MTMIPDWKKCLREAKKIAEAPANTLHEKLKKQQAIHRLTKYGMPRERHDMHIKGTIT